MNIYYKWLENWEEKQSIKGETGKRELEFGIDAHLAFDEGSASDDIEAFCKLAEKAAADPNFYDTPKGYSPNFFQNGKKITFESAIQYEDYPSNNQVHVQITKAKQQDHAVIVLHHWGAQERSGSFANLLARSGVTVVEMAMPYHLERAEDKVLDVDYFMSASLGRTIRSVRQAVMDARTVVDWLCDQGYTQVSVMGVSMGSWVAALVATHDARVTKLAAFMGPGDAARITWSGRTMRRTKNKLSSHVSFEMLDRAWLPLNMDYHASKLVRSNLAIQLVIAKRDKAVPTELSEEFVKVLHAHGRKPQITRLACGHYSLGKAPFSLIAVWKLLQFLRTPKQ